MTAYDKNTLKRKNYNIINFIFVFIILLIFLYTGILYKHMPDAGLLFSEEKTISTGLTRGFNAILLGSFEKAKAHNPYTLRIFLFFVLELTLRTSMLMLISKMKTTYLKTIILLDVLISTVLFFVFFFPFIKNMISIITRS